MSLNFSPFLLLLLPFLLQCDFEPRGPRSSPIQWAQSAFAGLEVADGSGLAAGQSITLDAA
jgi:hypothetical protein